MPNKIQYKTPTSYYSKTIDEDDRPMPRMPISTKPKRPKKTSNGGTSTTKKHCK
jgi:hypothetical protein